MSDTAEPILWKRVESPGCFPDAARGAHYSIFSAVSGREMEALRLLFPDGKADYMNFVLFSTDGVHGSYGTIEDAIKNKNSVTFLVVQPRLVCLRYGNVKGENRADWAFLKRLRKTSQAVASTIGWP